MDDLTRSFSPSCWVPGKTRDEVMNEFFSGIQASFDDIKNDQKVPRQEDIPYGKEENQKIDVWGEVNDKLVIFFHGGYWVEGDRKTCLPPVRCALNSGYAFASVGYGLAINGRTLTKTVDDAVKGVKFLLEQYPNVTKVIVGGHSAGALLAFHSVTRLCNPRIKGMLLFAGCYFLGEIVHTEIGQAMYLTIEQAKLNSCDLSKMDGLNLKNLVLFGYQEAPKLIEQNQKFVDDSSESRAAKFSNLGHYTLMTHLMNNNSGVFMAMTEFLKSF